MQWVRVIDGALQEWEAENVKPGPSKQLNRDTIYFHPDNATGIRRRIQKRAIAGDDQAQASIARDESALKREGRRVLQ